VGEALVADLSSGDVTRVSVTSEGRELVPFEYRESAGLYRDGVTEVALSGDGRVVAFATHANGLVPEDSNNNVDIYVHDLVAPRTERASVTSSGADGYREEDRECGSNGECFSFIWSHSPTLSHDGRYISFLSGAPLLDPTCDGQKGSDENVFVHDRQTRLTALVDRTFRGEPARGYNLYGGSISSDGRWISFETDGRLLRKRHGRGENANVYIQRLPAPFGPSDSG
jgi:bifunctional DNA-binding transcriptional regulator/antitoxin component of YhaV-PrlF toxin-antitoxin module